MILVCAANGRIGRRVVSQLADHANRQSVVAGVRELASGAPAVPAGVDVRVVNYDDVESMASAFEGIERVVFIPSYADTDQRAQQGENVIEAATRAGIRQILFVGIMDTRADSPLPFAHAYGRIEAAVESSELDWVILRTSMYTDNLAEQYPMWLEKGELITCAGDGRISYVSRDDIARSIVGVLKDPIPDHARTRYVLTGPVALSYDEVGKIISEEFDLEIAVTDVNQSEFADRLFEIWGVAYEGIEHVARVTPLFQAVFKEGQMSAVTRDVEQLSGQEPEDIRSWIQRHKAEEASA